MDLKEFKIKNRYTYGHLAEMFGCSYQHMALVTTGKVKCSKTLAMLIEAVTEKQVTWQEVLRMYQEK
jgi:hypothetical protein